MGLLGKKTRSVVGLDIEPGFVAAAEFANGGTKPTLNKAATGALLPGLFHEGEVTDVDGLAEQLRVFFRDNDLPKVVRLGVASQKVVVRVIELPEIEGEAELEAAVRFQAQEELPMPLEQAVLDHRVLERYSDGETTRMRVLMVAARRDTVEHMLAAARKAGLDPQLIDLSAFAIVRALYVPPHGHASQGAGNGAVESHGVPVAVDHPADQAGEGPQGGAGADPAAAGGGTALEPSLGDVVTGDVTFTPPDTSPESEQPAGADDPLRHLLPDEGQADQPASPEQSDPASEPSAATDDLPQTADSEQGAVNSEVGATLYCYVGGLTNLAIATGTECVFNRVLQNSIESMSATLAGQKALTLEHARQWLKHVALEKDVDSIDGEREIVTAAREVLQRGANKIADEVRLSLEYYQGSISNASPVERVVLAGQAIALPGFASVLEMEIGLPVESRSLGALEVRPGALDGVDGSQLTVAAGLAIDEAETA